MNDIVPGALQRLREADIVGLAGLASASLGQEYCRRGYMSATKRQGVRLSGVVEIPDMSPEPIITRLLDAPPQREEEPSGILSAPIQRFEVEAEMVSRD